MPNVITRCHCTSSYQDAAYGAGQRVHTVGTNAATCTVCGAKNSKPAGAAPTAKKEKK